jgi:hypothetical protein
MDDFEGIGGWFWLLGLLFMPQLTLTPGYVSPERPALAQTQAGEQIPGGAQTESSDDALADLDASEQQAAPPKPPEPQADTQPEPQTGGDDALADLETAPEQQQAEQPQAEQQQPAQQQGEQPVQQQTAGGDAQNAPAFAMVPTGYRYKLGSKVNSELCFKASDDGRSVTLQPCAEVAVDYVDMEPPGREPGSAVKDGDAFYVTIGETCLAARPAGPAQKGAPLRMVACSGAPEQTWRTASGDGFGTLYLENQICADVANGDVKPGARLIAWPCANTPSQQIVFFLTARPEPPAPAENTRSYSPRLAPELCLASVGDGKDLRLAACASSPEQAFAGASGETIRTAGLCLGGRQAALKQGSPLRFIACDAPGVVKPTITEDGKWELGSGLCLDLANGDAAPNAPLVAWPCGERASQYFDLAGG